MELFVDDDSFIGSSSDVLNSTNPGSLACKKYLFDSSFDEPSAD